FLLFIVPSPPRFSLFPLPVLLRSFFSFYAPSASPFYTLSLHDALPIFGRRDVPFDIDLPVPLSRCRLQDDGTWGPVQPLTGWQVTRLNDQHAYLQTIAEAQPDPPQPGDVIAVGISHPCTLFDKWRTAVVVDDQLRVLDVVTTDF